MSESSQIYEEIHQERIMFLENNIKVRNDTFEQKNGESLQSEYGELP